MTPTVTRKKPPLKKLTAKRHVDRSIQSRLENCNYSFVFCQVTWCFEDGTLTLSGCVPTFFLKQTLQELLRGVEQVQKIKNEVDVVNSNGLSSVRPNKPRAK